MMIYALRLRETLKLHGRCYVGLFAGRRTSSFFNLLLFSPLFDPRLVACCSYNKMENWGTETKTYLLV